MPQRLLSRGKKISEDRLRIDDACRVSIISDLHKYSGVSNFSKGDNPFSSIYYDIYKREQLGTIHTPENELSNEQQDEIEHAVTRNLSASRIAYWVDYMLTPQQQSELIRKHDPNGLWQKRQEVFESFRKSDYVVLNGDIFDIECCKDQQKKIIEAVEWLKARMDDAPDTQFHFVLGNHEAFKDFKSALNVLARDEDYGDRFTYHEHYFQLNDSLFVHGDEYLGIAKYLEAYKKSHHSIASPEVDVERHKNRDRELQGSELSLLSRQAYEWFNGTYHKTKNVWDGIHNIVSTLYDKIGASNTEGLAEAFGESRHVFSGHTHEPYAEHFKDKYFYNAGASLASRFAAFRPLSLTMEHGRTCRVEPMLERDRKKFLLREQPKLPEHGVRKYFVASDLHIFDDGFSRNDRVKKDMKRAIEEADVIVLNGDIFELFYAKSTISDYRSPQRTPENAMRQSIAWLKEFAQENANKEIHFVLGNHEGVPDFIDAVRELEGNFNNFKLHEHFFQPNTKNLFLHGDEVMDGKFKQRTLYPLEKADAHYVKKLLNRRLESVAMPMVRKWHHPFSVAKKIVSAIPTIPGIDRPDEIENVFFGHTHVPFVDLWQDGKWVTNTGGATYHAQFAAVTFDMAMDGTITPPRIIDHTNDMGVVKVLGF